MKYVFIIIGIVVVGIIAYVAFSPDNIAQTQSVTWPSGNIVPEGPVVHDWGSINIKGGEVEHVFTLENESSEPLQIKTASTSCMCTSAYITVGDETSPTFGMHNNPSNWGRVVDAGDEFTVRVVFDPMAHGPDAVGRIQRSVYIETSAVPDGTYAKPDSSTNGSILELQTAGNVIYQDEYMSMMQEPGADEEYQYVMGDFVFKEKEVDLGVVKQSAGIQMYDFAFKYTGDDLVTIAGTPGSCACTTAEVSMSELKKGDTSVVTLSFDPNLHEEPEGRFFKTINVLTDPTQEETIELKMWAEIDLDLGPESYKLQEHND